MEIKCLSYRLLKPLLFMLQAETAHKAALGVGSLVRNIPGGTKIVNSLYQYSDARLSQSLHGIDFENPVGLAAGFDKNAAHIDFLASLGLGFIEIGSVSNHPRGGNPLPRLFRLPKDRALINRMGLNNDGANAVARNLQHTQTQLPIGINMVKTHDPRIAGDAAIKDFSECYRKLAAFGAYHTLNISCPNTAEGKTFEDPEALAELLQEISTVRTQLALQTPLFIKISSDLPLDSVEKTVSLCLDYGVCGLVAANTSNSRKLLRTSAETLAAIGKGGLSGAPLFSKSLNSIATAYQAAAGKLMIIGTGGVMKPGDALQMLQAGASLVQIYTGMVYYGPSLCLDINRFLSRHCQQHSLESITEVIGQHAAARTSTGQRK
ncbi:MAG: quinone-dependent dihydroorotate dehydrogenase [Gammaproteobacteria bacterium]|nr:quinone-dependent dihydroorotate dehydrogenase [Gammaproteobacteria bacterium]